MPTEIKYSQEEHFDISRQREKESFYYRWVQNGGMVKNKHVLDHIENLVIPPNWKEVRICSEDCMHILAYGYDDKGRKQYIYHPQWHEQRNKEKFDELKEFAVFLPRIRRRVNKDLRKRDWVKDKVLALMVMTLDETYIRIGNTFYQRQNATHGLSTLRRKHVDFAGDRVMFEFKGKSNKIRNVTLANKRLARLIKKSAELPGYELFRYKHNGSFRNVSSSDVNDYLYRITGKEYFTAKDFRTWGGTTLAVEYYPEAVKMCAENKRIKLDTTLVKLVAEKLGNTISICRDYYIHPNVFKLIETGEGDRLRYRNHRKGKYTLSAAEKKVKEIVTMS
jgi:DNA topoisomerase-1